MKQIISHTQKVIRITLLSSLLVSASLLSQANGSHEKHRGSASTAEVKYIGTQDGSPLFNVTYMNSGGARFSLKVMDADGTQLFQEVYTDKKFDKKFKIAEPQEYSKLIFIVRNLEDNSEQTFEINSNTRMIEDVEVKELN